MRFKRLTAALIGLTALWLTGCGVSRTATNTSVESRVAEERITEARDSVVVELRDTLKEVTTVTVDRNDVGDTLRVTTVTDRTRASVRDRVRDVEVKIVEKTDTVYVERRDSSLQVLGLAKRQSRATAYGLQEGDRARASPVVSALKWIFWIIIAIGGLVIIFKVSKVFKFLV